MCRNRYSTLCNQFNKNDKEASVELSGCKCKYETGKNKDRTVWDSVPVSLYESKL